MVDIINELPKGTKVYLLAPIVRGHKGEFKREIMNLKKQGFQKLIVNGEVCEIDDLPKLDKNKKHNIEVIVDRIVLDESLGNRLADSLESSLNLAEGITYLEIVELPPAVKTEFEKINVLLFRKIFLSGIRFSAY